MPYILQPPDFKIVQSVIHLLIEADWFDRTSENEKACTQFVLVMYGRGGLTKDELYDKCIETAKELFVKPRRPRFVGV